MRGYASLALRIMYFRCAAARFSGRSIASEIGPVTVRVPRPLGLEFRVMEPAL